jgi:hypothetical protein
LTGTGRILAAAPLAYHCSTVISNGRKKVFPLSLRSPNMRGILVGVSLATGIVLALCVALQAVEPTDSPNNMGRDAMAQQHTVGQIVRATDLIGLEVRGQNNEKIGKVDNLAIDQTGQVRYAVVSFGGTMGIGAKMLPLPWQALTLESMPRPGERATTSPYCVLGIDKDTLAKAPSFESGQWPNFNDQKWVLSIGQFYRPYLAKRLGGSYTR